jgi:ornithine cyclodeaminase/alanine dehydrogenase-like protein (mu-crystallin family)
MFLSLSQGKIYHTRSRASLKDGCTQVLHITEAEVRRLFVFPRAIELAREAYVKLERREALNPERVLLSVPGGAALFFMPAHVLGHRTVSIKVARTNPRNPAQSLPTVMLTVYVYDSQTGAELAQIEAEALTAIRTAASTAVATDLLAREDAETLGVFGSGREAEAHIAAIREVRHLSRILIYSRERKRREAFVANVVATHGIQTTAAESPEELLEESDVIITATTSETPVFNSRKVRPGTHVNAIGAALPGRREVDTSLVQRSILVVDSRQQALLTYGDVVIPIEEHVIDASHIRAELGELLVRGQTLERGPGDITLFKSGGLAVLDAVAADFIVSQFSSSTAY